jgi:hypothetical protein
MHGPMNVKEAPNLCFTSSSYLGDMVTYKNRLLEQTGCERNEEHPRFYCTLVVAAGLNNSVGLQAGFPS